jgi:protein gp37
MRAHPDRIERGLYWDRSLTLVAGCTPVSPSCENCWSATEAHMRAGHPHPEMRARGEGLTCKGRFNGRKEEIENGIRAL